MHRSKIKCANDKAKRKLNFFPVLLMATGNTIVIPSLLAKLQ